MKNKKLFFVAAVTTMAFIPILAGENAFAQDETINITGGNIEITETGYSLGGGNETAHSNEYTIIQSSDGIVYNRIVIESGDIKMTIKDIDITADGGAAIAVKNGATLELVLEGENTLEGDEGFAGISVEAYFDDEYDPDKSGHVIISGDGSLSAKGGAATSNTVGGGAGIGGDGFNGEAGRNFGVVEIRDGNIEAEGGKAVSLKFGAGAGIGGGGFGNSKINTQIDRIYAGRIYIKGGDIEAQGGAAFSGFCGAAGIGSGTGNGYGDRAFGNSMVTEITGGNIKAYGAECAAGIGGSVNGSFGEITIGGDAVVEAVGGSDGYFSGAGIGGGDSGGGSRKITIGGDAVVEAVGGNCAAGIGGGYGGYIANITIEGNADVTAFGGIYGGAGIGSGNGAGFYYDEGYEGVINLDTEGVVIAYGGNGANAVGLGGRAQEDIRPSTIVIGENSGGIWLFGYNENTPALLGVNADNTIDTEKLVLNSQTVHWHNGYSEEQEILDYLAYFWNGKEIDNETYSWEKAESVLRILLGEEEVAAQAYSSGNHHDNAGWAVVLHENITGDAEEPDEPGDSGETENPDEPGDSGESDEPEKPSGGSGGYELDRNYSINYETNGGKELPSESSGGTWTKDFDELPVPERYGYEFDGWYRDEELTDEVTDDLRIRNSITVYAGWVPAGNWTAPPEDTGVSETLNTIGHGAYMMGYPDGTFRPEASLTRAEAAQIFYGLLLERPKAQKTGFDDVDETAWYSDAVYTLADLGIIDRNGLFEPDRNITRAEFVDMAARFARRAETDGISFLDVSEDDWFYESVMTAVGYGWIKGYPDGTFRPEASLTRAEAAVIVNNMLARNADAEYIGQNTYFSGYTDVNEDHWAYGAIMEASVSHAFIKDGGWESWLAVL